MPLQTCAYGLLGCLLYNFFLCVPFQYRAPGSGGRRAGGFCDGLSRIAACMLVGERPRHMLPCSYELSCHLMPHSGDVNTFSAGLLLTSVSFIWSVHPWDSSWDLKTKNKTIAESAYPLPWRALDELLVRSTAPLRRYATFSTTSVFANDTPAAGSLGLRRGCVPSALHWSWTFR